MQAATGGTGVKWIPHRRKEHTSLLLITHLLLTAAAVGGAHLKDRFANTQKSSFVSDPITAEAKQEQCIKDNENTCPRRESKNTC